MWIHDVDFPNRDIVTLSRECVTLGNIPSIHPFAGTDAELTPLPMPQPKYFEPSARRQHELRTVMPLRPS